MIAAVISTGLAVVVVIAGLVWLAGTKRILASRFRERVIVTTKTGEAFHGILVSADRKALVLRETSALGAGERKTDLPLDGELIVLLPDVAYIQRP